MQTSKSAVALLVLFAFLSLCNTIYRVAYPSALYDTYKDMDSPLRPKDSVAWAMRHAQQSMDMAEIDNLTWNFTSNFETNTIIYSQNDKVTVLVPYRNRRLDLLAFLAHMTAYFRIRDIKFDIVVIEQSGDRRFNRGALFNVALREIFAAAPDDRLYGSTCFALHDVDKLPMAISTPYHCMLRPNQLLRYVHYPEGGLRFFRRLLGGVTVMSKDQLLAINGASNTFFGWGGEDDDLYKRASFVHIAPRRWTTRFDEGQFYEEFGATHPRDRASERFYRLTKSSPQRMQLDGLRQIKYKLLKRRDFRHFVWLLVEL